MVFVVVVVVVGLLCLNYTDSNSRKGQHSLSAVSGRRLGGWGTLSLQGAVGLQQVPTLTASDGSEEKVLAVGIGV